MPISETDSQGETFFRLLAKLNRRRPRIQKLLSYYEGTPPLPTVSSTGRAKFEAFQKKSRTNFARLIVKAPQHRIQPLGFRTGASDDDNGDQEARRIWLHNGLDVESAQVHQTYLTCGDSYAIVGMDEDNEPLITFEHPLQVVTEHNPRKQREITAGLKVFLDEVENIEYAYLYTPGRVDVAWREFQENSGGFTSDDTTGWEWAPELSGNLPPEFGKIVPIVRFRNEDGVGEYEPYLDHLDRINFTIFQRMVIVAMQAFRQRALKTPEGSELPQTDDSGAEINWTEIFTNDPGSLWLLPDGADLWESAQADIGPILAAVKNDVQDLAAVTFTPLFMISPDAANGSAEGASLMRESLVFKTKGHITRVRQGWAQVMYLAFLFKGDAQRADLATLDPIFADPEQYSLSERSDAATKAQGIVPRRSILTDIYQFTPEQVRRMEVEIATDILFSPSATPQPGQQPQAPANGQDPAPPELDQDAGR